MIQVDLVQNSVAELKNYFGLESVPRSLLYIGAVIIALGLLGVIWALGMKKPNAPQYLISWVVAIAFYLFIAGIF